MHIIIMIDNNELKSVISMQMSQICLLIEKKIDYQCILVDLAFFRVQRFFFYK